MGNCYMTSIRPSLLKVDQKYQRETELKAVKKIVKNWDEMLVNPPKVSSREDGSYYVFDGQHTVAAWIEVHGDEPIICRVYTGLTESQEKDLFVKQNGVVTNVKSREKLRAEYNFDNPEITDMVKCAMLLGLTVKFDTPTNGDNVINAVECLNSIYKRLGRDNFINVLTVIKNTWNGEKSSLTRGILSGVAFIYEHFNERVTNAKMIEALRRHTPDYYMREAKEMSGPLGRRVARVMIKSYNFQKKSNRLPEF